MSETTRIIKLGQTDGFRYIGFKPPLTNEELNDIPMPHASFGGNEFDWQPTSVQKHLKDGTMDVGFDSTSFEMGESFESYAKRVAAHLGGCSLDTTVHIIGPGGVIAQANGKPAEW